MKCSRMVMKAFLAGAPMLTLAWPASAVAGTTTVVSDTKWNVFDANGQFLGLAQAVCLNATSPTNCNVGAPAPMLFLYPSPGWPADLSGLPTGARWIWAPGITGTSSPAALQEFTFETDFYVCDPPLGGSISIAVDNSAEVTLNGTLVPNSMANSQSAVKTFTVPVTSLKGSSLLKGLQPNHVKVKATNAANPNDCASDQYRCNPAGLVLGGTFQFSGDPPCAGYKGGTYQHGESETISMCPPGQSGSVYHVCLCGQWTPNVHACVSPPPTCTGNDGRTYQVNETEPVPCPANRPVGSASRRCQSQGTWGNPDFGQCQPTPVTCRGSGGALFNVGQTESLPCPPPRTMGSRTRTCKNDGSWTDIVDTCRLPNVCVGAPPGTCICGNSSQGQTGNCPPGVDCGPRPIGPQRVSSDWFCGLLPLTVLGESCTSNGQCASGYCDRGDGTSKTSKCMPRAGTGSINDPCSNNNQCASGRCGGLRQDIAGAWHPGRCSSNTKSALGEFCSVNSDCASNYCDRGDGTSKTSRCMPFGNGSSGNPCSNHNQCASRVCSGLQGLPDGSWQPGQCN